MLQEIFEDLAEKATEVGFELRAVKMDQYSGFFTLCRDKDTIDFYLRPDGDEITIREDVVPDMSEEIWADVTPIVVRNCTSLVILAILLRTKLYQF